MNKWDKLIIFDIDETLLYATEDPRDGKYDMILSGFDQKYYVWKRPGLDDFLQKCSDHFEHIAIWTAADEEFCKEVCTQVIKKNLAFAYSSKRCTVKLVADFDRGLETKRIVIKVRVV
jgi:RNA polymerase II subunit A small phosphatase-like protein